MKVDPHSLSCTGVGVDFAGLVALDDVSLTVARGEILGLIGPNGAGKTTLLNVLSGFQAPTAGVVRQGEKEITSWPPRRRARNGIGRTFQGVRVFPRLTVAENIEVGALGTGKSRRQARELASGIAATLNLGEYMDTDAEALPFGIERRLGIARSVAAEPVFLLLDEPSAGLDESESDELLHSIREIAGDLGCGVILIEHDMSLVMRLCERIQVLDHGRTLAIGTPDEVQSNPLVIEAYLGEEATSDA